jgi:hypothetical protein
MVFCGFTNRALGCVIGTLHTVRVRCDIAVPREKLIISKVHNNEALFNFDNLLVQNHKSQLFGGLAWFVLVNRYKVVKKKLISL